MLKKMQRRFIASAMAAVGVVTLVLLIAVNVWNYSIATQRLDSTIESLYENGSAPDIFSGSAAEQRYMTRFFVVLYDKDGNADSVLRDYIATVSVEDALNYGDKALRRADKGYIGEYRYNVERSEGGTVVIFLNSWSQQQSMRSLLRVSLVITGLSLLAEFGLIAAFSKRAIAPYVRNIEMQKQFITDAGHELKTPLTSISTSAEVLEMESGENEWIANIKKQTARLTKLVNNLVTLSKLDEGAPLPDKTEFSLSDAAWEAAEPFDSRALAQGKSYTRDISDGISMVGDMAAVQQVISILLDNAFKYSPDGGEIRLTVCERKKSKVIEVYNTCDAASLGDVSRFFDRFYRADKSRSSSGTGIGLSIAKATAEAMGGDITAEKTGDDGITFRVTI